MRGSPKSPVERVMRLAAAACLAALPVILLAGQEPPVANDVPVEDASSPDEVIDEIRVVAPRTARSIRLDIIEVEKVMYDIFNSLNTDPDFRVSCGWENRDTGNPSTTSRIKEWRCHTAYESYIVAQEFGGAAGAAAIQNAMQASGSMAGPLRRHREALKQHMAELGEQSPELARAIYIRAALEQDLATALKRKSESE
jgi:hypothetical protein